jgi:hypothetical protein
VALLIGMGMGAEEDIIALPAEPLFWNESVWHRVRICVWRVCAGGALGTLPMGAGFDFTRSQTVPLARFFLAMPAGPMTRRGQHRNTATYGRNEHAVEALQAENPG